ncbi:PfkB family carbohydrate kinase [Pseudoalteromonas sp. SR41-4]|uniref:PfkB family carbohydrate kinase n=1 Tax=Pseudoalteromonas sp. SR41-4 TaxID=2760950 RepID=UPI0015FF0D6B|nr:PfkB family carbohydrate kinase [Pseudoalteromonas sp. SR41-4]MBB1291536.1 hypothetical protein [Pseudoalteromonas sp. SR41-4]
MIKIAFFGEAMHELSTNQELNLGGDTYNTAVYFKRLMGEQVHVYFISAIGSDELSKQAKARWQQQALKLDFLQYATNHTLGAYGITLDANGERVFHYDRKNSAAREYFKLDTQHQFLTALQQQQFDYLYFSAISLAIYDDPTKQLLMTAIAQFKQAGGIVIFDSNYRQVLWQSNMQAHYWFRQAFLVADIIFVTNDDHFGVFGDCEQQQLVDFYRAYPQALRVIKQGLDDTIVLQQQTINYYPVTAVAKVIDTTAAGDAFAAGFLAEQILASPCAIAVQTAQQLAAQVITAAGAIVATTVTLKASKQQELNNA